MASFRGPFHYQTYMKKEKEKKEKQQKQQQQQQEKQQQQQEQQQVQQALWEMGKKFVQGGHYMAARVVAGPSILNQGNWQEQQGFNNVGYRNYSNQGHTPNAENQSYQATQENWQEEHQGYNIGYQYDSNQGHAPNNV